MNKAEQKELDFLRQEPKVTYSADSTSLRSSEAPCTFVSAQTIEKGLWIGNGLPSWLFWQHERPAPAQNGIATSRQPDSVGAEHWGKDTHTLHQADLCSHWQLRLTTSTHLPRLPLKAGVWLQCCYLYMQSKCWERKKISIITLAAPLLSW